MKDRWKILIAAGIVLALLAASMTVTMRVQPENKVEAYKKLLREKGEKLEISEVLPPPVPETSNGLSLFEAAAASFVPASEDDSNLPSAMQMISAGRAVVCSMQPYWFANDGTYGSNSWENTEAAVEANRPATELLKQAATYSAIDFHLDYYKGYDLNLQHLEPLKQSAQRLSAAAMCDLHAGNVAAAATNICAILRLVQAQRDERVKLSQLVRGSMSIIALNATWELLQSTNVTAGELATLQARWEQLDFFSGAEGSVLMERAWAERMVLALRTSVAEFGRVMGSGSGGSSWSFASSGNWLEDIGGLAKTGWETGKGYGGLMMWQNSWGYDDELRLLQKKQIELAVLRMAQTNQALKPLMDWQEAQLADMKITNSPGAFMRAMEWDGIRRFFSESFFSTDSSLKKYIRAETAKQMVVVAIALKRFQLKHGGLPEKLSELAPEFLPSAPLDSMDGKPLRYHPNGDGTFLLYSVGEDGVDDGGDTTSTKSSSSGSPNWNWWLGRDWVWPQPATATEIQTYDEEQSRKAK